MDITLIRKLASQELGKRALEELTSESDTSLDDVFLNKAARAEDPQLFKIAMSLKGDPIEQYEALGGKYKQAFGQAMFDITPAPDPVAQMKQQQQTAAPKAPSSSGSQSASNTTSVSSAPSTPGTGMGMG